MKKILGLLLATVVSLGAWANGTEINGICYLFDQTTKTATVTYKGSSAGSSTNNYTGSVAIPEKVLYYGEEYTVTCIGENAFMSCKGLTYVSIPNTVTTIESQAFYQTGLTSVTIGSNVTALGASAFGGSTSLTKVTLSEGLKSIGNYCFSSCTALSSINLPNSLETLGNNAFYKCKFTAITIPVGLATIGNSVFSDCKSLTSVVWNAKQTNAPTDYYYAPFYSIASQITSFVFGDSVVAIPRYICYNMSQLQSLTIPENVTSISNTSFTNCTGLRTIEFNAKRCYLSSSTLLPSGVQSNITSVTFGDKVEWVPAYMCESMSKLTSIKIPNSVRRINRQAFASCTRLASVKFGNSVDTIDIQAFNNCTSLATLDLPESVTYIGSSAFRNCSALTSVVIPKNVKKIGATAFEGMPSLTEVVMLPETVVEHPENNHVFYSSMSQVPLYVVSAEAATAYQSSLWGTEFANIKSEFPYTLTVQSENEQKGSAVVEKEATWKEPQAIIRATPKSGYGFAQWSDGNTDNPRSVDVLHYGSKTINLTAKFGTMHDVNIEIKGSGSASMNVQVGDGEVSNVNKLAGTYAEGTTLHIKLKIASDSYLEKWSDNNTQTERTFTVTSPINLTITVNKQYQVTLLDDGNGYTTGAGRYPKGYVTIEAIPYDAETYRFDHWSDGSTENPRNLYVSKDITLTAYFVQGWNGHTACEPAGQGTDEHPYLITRACELLWYKQQVDQDANYTAIINVDTISLENQTWEPIGSVGHPFRGKFDGRNHYITNFRVENNQNAGLFGYADNARIANIKVSNATVRAQNNTGIVCGQAHNTEIIACDNYATVSGKERVGGICGYLLSSEISNCNNWGEVQATGDYAGGVAGYVSNSKVANCSNSKSVSSTGQYVGGVAGIVSGSQSVLSSCTSGKEATVSGTKYVGGLCGKLENGSISTSSTIGAVYGTDQEVGGMIGHMENAEASKLTNYGRVHSTSSNVGGAIGYAIGSTISYCANTGMIVATNDQNVGGLIGYSEQTTITSSLNTGVIKGKNYTGGLVGYLYDNSSLNFSANYGPVSGADRVGGVTGESRAPMKECFSTGHVSGTGTHVGGISGWLNQDDYSDVCYYDIQMCPLKIPFGYDNGGAEGEGLKTSQLTGNVSALKGDLFNSWSMAEGCYPIPATIHVAAVGHVAASVVLFDDNDDADNFSKNATLTVVNTAKWSSKGGTKIENNSVAKPAILGPDTLYVNRLNASKAVVVRVTASTLPSYTLTIKAGEHGQVDNEGGTFAEGTEVTVTAIPDEKYQFAQWNDGNKNNPRTFTVTANASYTAQFEKIPLPKYQVTVTAGQGGTVNNVSGEYEEDTELTLRATPNNGWRFVRWSDGNTDNPRTLVVTGAVTLSAEFEEIPPQQFTITISASEGGTVNSAQVNGTYNEGTELTLIATPDDEDHFFVQWSDGVKTNPRTLTLTSDTTLSAEFGAYPYYKLTVIAGEGGTVNDTVNRSYREGTEVTIEAKPNEDYVFLYWSDGIERNPRTIILTSDTTIRAEFAAIQYFQFAVNAGEGGTVNDTVNGRYRTGDKVTIEAKPKDADHRFVSWSDGIKTNPRTITITADSTITALFEAIPYYTLKITAGQGGTVDETVNNSYREGTEVTLKATPDEDHTFLKWSDGNTDNPRTIIMMEDKTLEAQFSEIVRLEVWIGTAIGGTVNTEASGRYEEGTTITLRATPDRGYVFDHWSDGSKANPYNYTVPDTDVVIYPVFYQSNCVQ